jgi:Tol biopolymer transport system component
VWSPDGTQIAFQGGGWYDKKTVELRTTTLDGDQRTLYACAKGEGGYPIEWLPKGDLILCELNKDGVHTLGVVSVSNGKFRPLRKLPGGTDGSCSPDGKYIVFHERKGESRNLSIISTDGKTYKPLTEGPADDKQPHWSPDGSHIVFLSHRHGGWALWGIAVDKEGNPAGSPFLIQDGMQNANLRNWTKRGLYYQNWVDTTDVFVASINPEMGEITGKLQQIDYTPTGNNKRPVWSHDGEYLAFASSNEDYAYKGYVVIMPASGGEAKKFPFPTQGYSAPWFHSMRWRPDSKAVGLLCRSNERKMAFFVVDLETGQWQEWPLSRAYDRRTRVEWTGDGKGIYLAQIGRENKEPGIVEHDLKTGEERYVYKSKYTENHIFSDLTSSRDFSKLAIMDGNRYLVIVDTKTRKVVQEFTRGMDDPMHMSSLAWSPEGDRLFVLNRVREGRNIKGYSILSIKDGSENRFESDGILPKRLTYSDWTPDGTRIAFSTRAMKYDIFILSNIIPKSR